MGELLGPLDDQIIIWIQTFSPLFDFIFGLVTLFGDELVVVLIIGFLFFCIDKKIAIRSAFLVVITYFFTILLKGYFGLQRPYIVNSAEIKGIPDLLGQLPDDYTFPSGHSSNVGAFWSYLASKCRHRSFWVLAILMIIIIPISRVYLGVHWPTDIIIGVFLGVLVSLIFIFLLPKVEGFIDKANPIFLAFMAIIIPIMGVIVSYLLILSMGNQIEYADPSPMGGLFVGLSIGAMLEHRFVNLKVKEYRENKKVLVYRAVLGLIVILGTYLSMSVIFGLLFEEWPLKQISRFCRYAILAFVGIFCLPWLFVFIEQKLSLEPNIPKKMIL
ncbi:MAG: phosphatase PAP2 family protein [Promethearchaeota archaeon]